MDPHDPERISLYLDDELSPEERVLVEAHLAGCAGCRETRDAFLKVRELLRSEAEAERPADRLAQHRALREILQARPPAPLWRRPVTLPAPGLAGLLAALAFALGTLVIERVPSRSAAPGTAAPTPAGTERAERPIPAPSESPQAAEALDLARFDRGRRLEIYVAEHPRGEER